MSWSDCGNSLSHGGITLASQGLMLVPLQGILSFKIQNAFGSTLPATRDLVDYFCQAALGIVLK